MQRRQQRSVPRRAIAGPADHRQQARTQWGSIAVARNSKARRDARKRKQTRQRPGSTGSKPGSPLGDGAEFTVDPVAFADLRVVTEVQRLGFRGSEEEALRRAGSLQRERVPGWALAEAVTDLLDRLTSAALHGGWSPAELANVVVRIVGEGHQTVLAWLVGAARQGGSLGSMAWEAESAALGRPRALDVESVEDLALALRLAALFSMLPASEMPTGRQAATASDPADSRASGQLAKVRALLAKAEATTFADEAEALSAKAQELISKHSLEQLLQHEADRATDAPPSTTYRRLWLDSPYVDAKATLVDEIAGANRCRAVYAHKLGYCTIIGSRFDLDAVDLMLTSLLAQAQRAMLRHGSRHSGGHSRTRSFRQSFLVSFAIHIGRRLRHVANESVAATGGSSLLPALRHHESEVDELTSIMFPTLVEKATSVTNAEGWAGGRLAAELADLDLFEAVRA